MNTTPAENGVFRECYVGFIDVLGFKRLVIESESNPELRGAIANLTTMAASIPSGVKMTNAGPCPIQVRAFSDNIVIFSPRNAFEGQESNSLAHLCLVVRYVTDVFLSMGLMTRGAITIGNMYWLPSWDKNDVDASVARRAGSQITFGSGLSNAYMLESKKAVYPRIIVDDCLVESCSRLSANPFAKSGEMGDYFRRIGRERWRTLDLLNPEVSRSVGEELTSNSRGFSVRWDQQDESKHEMLFAIIMSEITKQLCDPTNSEKVRKKYLRFRRYLESVSPDLSARYAFTDC